MFEKIRLKRRIKVLDERILFLEKKRERSQAALVEAILKGCEPKDEDVDYFNRYTRNIDEVRKERRENQEKLDRLIKTGKSDK